MNTTSKLLESPARRLSWPISLLVLLLGYALGHTQANIEQQTQWFRAVNINLLIGTNAPYSGYPPVKNTNFVDRFVHIGLRPDGVVIWKDMTNP